MTLGAIIEFQIVAAAAQRFAKGAVKKRLPMGSWSEVVDYCRAAMALAAAIVLVHKLPCPCPLHSDDLSVARPSIAQR